VLPGVSIENNFHLHHHFTTSSLQTLNNSVALPPKPGLRTTQNHFLGFTPCSLLQNLGLSSLQFTAKPLGFTPCSALQNRGIALQHTGLAHRKIQAMGGSISNPCPATSQPSHPPEKTFPGAVNQCGWTAGYNLPNRYRQTFSSAITLNLVPRLTLYRIPVSFDSFSRNRRNKTWSQTACHYDLCNPNSFRQTSFFRFSVFISG